MQQSKLNAAATKAYEKCNLPGFHSVASFFRSAHTEPKASEQIAIYNNKPTFAAFLTVRIERLGGTSASRIATFEVEIRNHENIISSKGLLNTFLYVWSAKFLCLPLSH